MMQNKATNKPKFRDYVISLGLILTMWQILTFYFSPLVVPTISSVVIQLGEILSTPAHFKMIGITGIRLVVGLTIGISIGFVVGALMGYFQRLNGIFKPIIGILQTVPPVSWVVLALVWFGFNGKPAIFIVITSTIPIIAINVCEGISRIDGSLLKMAQVYNFSEKKKIRHIIFPSLAPYFSSAFRIALGSGWKIAVMGEVLTTNDGIGGMLKLARLNVEPENIIAWSIMVVILFYLSDYLISRLFPKKEVKHARG